MFNRIRQGVRNVATKIKNKAIQIKGRLMGQKRIGTTARAGAGSGG